MGHRAETCQPINGQGFASGPVWVPQGHMARQQRGPNLTPSTGGDQSVIIIIDLFNVA